MIDVVIPYARDGSKELGKRYNEVMEKAEGAVLFLDHDVSLLNPEWYRMCLTALAALKDQPWGWITCLTNRIGCPFQKVTLDSDSNDLDHHRQVARHLWEKNGDKLSILQPDLCERQGHDTAWPSGFFLLTNRKVWEAVGGFSDGFLGVDTEYGRSLVKSGFQIWLMTGLYVYHRYDRCHEWKKGER